MGSSASIASTVSTLGDDLAGLDRELHQAAEAAYAAGLELDEHGVVKPFSSVAEPGAGCRVPAKQVAYQAYQAQSEGIRAAAQQVRTQAQAQLAGFLDELLAGSPKATPDLYVTAADFLRGLLAVPDEARRGFLTDFDAKLADLRQAQRDARTSLAARRAAGEQIKPGDPAYQPFRTAINDVKGFEQDAAAARRTPAWAEALNYKLGDFRAMSALEEAGRLPKRRLPGLPRALERGHPRPRRRRGNRRRHGTHLRTDERGRRAHRDRHLRRRQKTVA
jgi:hypothetical protein